MAPTIQEDQKKSDQERRQSSSRATAGHGTGRSDYVSRVKYNNSLPDIPFDAKFITYPFEPNRFVQYKPTSLERNYKHDLLTEVDLGVTIDLIDPSTYSVDPNAALHPDDEKLLEEDLISAPDSKRTRQHNRAVSWMRRTEYISTEYNRFQTSNEQVETKVGFKVRKKLQVTDLYKDRESQIAAIEGTFEAAKKPVLRHPDKPHVKPVEVLPLFPDFQTWHYNCAHVVFDSDPAPRGRNEPAQVEEMSQAQIRGMVDESGDQFVAYFLPNKDTMKKRKRDQDDGLENFDPGFEYTYRLAREYNWNVKNQGSKGYEENYFFVFRANEGVFYNELAIRVRLSKRRGKGGQGGVKSSVSELTVKHRDMNQHEINAQKQRLSQLESNPPEEEEEDEDEDEDEEMEEDAEKEGEDGAKEEDSGDDEFKESDEKEGEQMEEDKEENEEDEEEEEEEEEKEDNEEEEEEEEKDNVEEMEEEEENDAEEEEEQEEEEEGEEESEKASSSGEEEEAASSEED